MRRGPTSERPLPRVRPGRLAMTLGVANLFAGAIGGMPVCHGAGGMTAHYGFRRWTGGAPIMMGVALLFLALVFGASLSMLLAGFPLPILAGLLAIDGAASHRPAEGFAGTGALGARHRGRHHRFPQQPGNRIGWSAANLVGRGSASPPIGAAATKQSPLRARARRSESQSHSGLFLTHDLVRKVCNFSGSCFTASPRCPTAGARRAPIVRPQGRRFDDGHVVGEAVGDVELRAVRANSICQGRCPTRI